MREVDTLLGLPLAWLLGLFHIRQRRMPLKPRNVVVVKLLGLGSIVVASGALRAFRIAQPQARMSLVTFAAHRDLEPLLGVFDEILPVRHDRLLNLVTDIWRSILRIRLQKPDLVIDLEFFSKLTSVFCACSGTRYHLSFQLPARWRSRLLDGGIAFREDIHFGECVARILAPWGVNYHPRFYPEIAIPMSAQEEADRLLAKQASPRETAHTGFWVLINPHAHDLSPERQWPMHYFAELMDQLSIQWPDSLFGILGVADQREAAEQLRHRTSLPVQPRVQVLAGQTSLPVLSALLHRSVLLVTNDGGIMHLAAAVHTPIVALFGPESPVRYAPLSHSNSCRILSADVVCGPCLTYMNRKQAPCHGDHECMRQLHVDQVLKACLELRARKGEP